MLARWTRKLRQIWQFHARKSEGDVVQDVAEMEVFHVTRDAPYNEHVPFQPEMQITIGETHNPFFGFYEKEQTRPVDTPDGRVEVKIIRFLRAVRDGEVNPRNLPGDAIAIAQHYVMLTRELIMEEVRRDIAPDAPSRQRCLWVVETQEQANFWVQRFGEPSKIVRLRLDGVVHHADAALLLGDSEPLSVTYDRARAYWRGELSENPEPEMLFMGRATVLAVES